MQPPNRIFYDPDQVFPDWTTTETIQRSRIIIIPFLLGALILLALVCREAYYLYQDQRPANISTSTEDGDWRRSTRYWMNAQEVSRFYKVSLETVFSALEITPEPGDEKLILQELAEKYNKSPAEVWEALNHLNNLQPRRGTGP